jgi:hypothetical protein
MASALSLFPLDWFATKRADALRLKTLDQLVSRDFVHAASAQSVFFPDGSLSEAIMLRDVLSSLSGAFPKARDVERELKSVTVSNYSFKREGAEWSLENRHSYNRNYDPFQNDWDIFIGTKEGLIAIPIAGADFQAVMNLMPYLNGQYSVSAIEGEIDVTPAQINFLESLARLGALREVRQRRGDPRQIPPLLSLGHSGISIKGRNALLLIDPLFRPSNEEPGRCQEMASELLASADAVLISHHHWDHLDFQTIVRLPRKTQIIVPKTSNASFMNPPIRQYLECLGFSNISECAPFERLLIGDIEVYTRPFFGEPFGLDSTFDGITYLVNFRGLTLYGSVDACFDEHRSMEPIIKDIGASSKIDFFFFGCSGQRHDPPYLAPGLRRFSNELVKRPDLVQYHPDTTHIARWAEILRPRYLCPYADFFLRYSDASHLRLNDLERSTFSATVTQTRFISSDGQLQLAKLKRISQDVGSKLVSLQPMQGIRL